MSATLTAPAPNSSAASNRGRRIGILIVTYNAVNTLAKVLNRIPGEVWQNIEQVAVFDDASQDATYELAVGLKTLTGNDKLQVLKHSRNLGYGGNQKSGYRYFIEQGFDAVVLLHGDGQYAPEILATLYEPIVTGQADAVFGSRMMREHGGPLRGGMPLYKFLGNRILSAYENRTLGLHLSEFHSGYRAYSLHALKQIDLSNMTDDFHFDTEIIIKLNHQGFRIAEVPIPTYYGTEICYVNGFRYAWDVVRAVRRYQQTRRSIRRHPEFAEYFVHYPVKTSSHSSHAYLRAAAGSGHDILDVGCGEGFLAKELHEAGNRVYGVDALPAPRHKSSLAGYVQRDLDSGLTGAFEDRHFDRVLLMDVLEHLRSPEHLLVECRERLHRNGCLLVSLPNVANLTVRLMLLFGKWEYRDRGIMDRTHMRFYTRRSARRMLERAGFRIVEEKMTLMPLEVVIGSPERNPLLKVAHWCLIACTRLMPGLFGYQTFFIAQISTPRSPPARP
jgi:2-polyprenyl-3-methyl-5-hydroxy-6-metoxy-1,4-benzoquinol methylase